MVNRRKRSKQQAAASGERADGTYCTKKGPQQKRVVDVADDWSSWTATESKKLHVRSHCAEHVCPSDCLLVASDASMRAKQERSQSGLLLTGASV